jgi:hypothetical protein
MDRFILFLFLLCVFAPTASAQNTVGTVFNTDQAYDGLSLFTVGKETYLINNCGEVINHWTSEYLSGKSVYILPNGDLLRGEEIQNPDVPIPGIGGRLSIYSWNNELKWSHNFSSETITSHHDVFHLPNGNILVLIIEKMSADEAIAAGRKPDLLSEGFLYNEKIIEIKTSGSTDFEIVWEWSFWEHLVQDFDEDQDNFGDVLNNPQLLDINYLGDAGDFMNWLHVNSIQYNEALDQIIVSSRMMGEFYIIDHSTTTEEASAHSGGLRGKGGDFLYRWGNPQAYRAGGPEDKKLFGQHYPHWIPDALREGGKVIVFNNGFNKAENFSSVHTISPTVNSDGSYTVPIGKQIGPEDFDWTYKDPIDPVNFYSKILSSAQRLPNGNTLICEGTKGKFFELNEEDEIVWTYISPIGNDGPLSQGSEPAVKSVFRVDKYSYDHPGLQGKNLTPGDPIELDFDISDCQQVLSVPEIVDTERIRFQNPVGDRLIIDTNLIVEKVELYNLQGQKILVANQEKNINFTYIPPGIYFIKIFTDQGLLSKKIIKA